MQVKVSKRTISLLIIIGVFALIIFFFAKTPTTKGTSNNTPSEEVPIISVLAKAGYTPNELVAPANKKVILRVETKNTYDCSAAFKIPKLNVDTLLPANGYTDFEIPPQSAGTSITASCSMGMYGLQVKFQ